MHKKAFQIKKYLHEKLACPTDSNWPTDLSLAEIFQQNIFKNKLSMLKQKQQNTPHNLHSSRFTGTFGLSKNIPTEYVDTYVLCHVFHILPSLFYI